MICFNSDTRGLKIDRQLAVPYYIEELSYCVPFVFSKLRDQTYLSFSFDSQSYVNSDCQFRCKPLFVSARMNVRFCSTHARFLTRSGPTRKDRKTVCVLHSVDQELKFDALDNLFCIPTAAVQSLVYEMNVYCSAVGRYFLCHNILQVLGHVWLPFSVGDRGSTVVKLLCYKSEDRCFGPSWCHWNFSLT